MSSVEEENINDQLTNAATSCLIAAKFTMSWQSLLCAVLWATLTRNDEQAPREKMKGFSCYFETNIEC